jgi:hypothetical protein
MMSAGLEGRAMMAGAAAKAHRRVVKRNFIVY